MSTSSAITTNEIIDHYAYDQGRPRDPPRHGTSGSDQRPPPPQRQASGGSSNYGDDSSAKSIDYASTHRSTETPKSVERPRAGVLKTTGGDEPDMPRNPGFDIPEINFGRTINYGATQARNQTPNALVPGGGNQSHRPFSPADQGPTPPAHKPQGQPHGRKESEDIKRTMAWQPGHSTAGSGGQGLSAEQYVQQRAAHARTPSGNTLGGTRSTPSPSDMKRTDSYDRLNGRHSRGSSVDLLSRPGSRGANSALGFNSSGEVSSHLSAREQEQVARMTGGPLVNMGGHQRTDSQGSGLVAAIEAREREKQMVRPGQHTQAVQQAISQRQQQQQAAMAYQQQMAQQQMAQQQMAQQMAQQQMMQQQMAQQNYQQQMMTEQPGYSATGQGGSPYGPPQGTSPGGYGQAASFSRPLRAGPQGTQEVDPRMAPPQGQYGSVTPGSQARGVHPAHHGQAF